jgi:HK97 family phage major capsid protein
MSQTYGQIQSSLQAAIIATLPEDSEGDNWVYVEDFSDTYVIYYSNGETLQDDYTTDADGNITLAGKPEPVKPVTTYVPVSEAKAFASSVIERGLRIGRRSSGEAEQRMEATLLRLSPPAPPKPVIVKSEPLTYERHGPVSYFADLLLNHKYPHANERLQRHAQEMRVIAEERNQRAWRSIRAGEFETRIEPNRTDGYGGYFAPPLWMNELFATAVRPGRVLAGLIPHFDLPMGISSVNIPIIGTGTRTQHVADLEGVPDQDITDTAGSSTVATITGEADVALQMLEQSPAGAMIDFVLLKDMLEDYDRDLETQLLLGPGSAYQALLGVVNADTVVSYTDSSPTASKMWSYFGEMAAGIGDNRLLPPEVYLMRTARWSWLQTQEDTAGRPFGVPTPFFLGADDQTPDPAGGLISWPVFLDDAIPANLGTGQNQDLVICMRPTDLVLLEGQPQTNVYREVLSGSLGVRVQFHNRVAAITNRYPSGIYCLEGTGMVVPSGF